MKRYSIVEKSYGDGDILMEVREGNDGEFVRYDDIKHLLQNTSYNSDYAKSCSNCSIQPQCREENNVMPCSDKYEFWK